MMNQSEEYEDMPVEEKKKKQGFRQLLMENSEEDTGIWTFLQILMV